MAAKFVALIVFVAVAHGATVPPAKEADTPNILKDVEKHAAAFYKTFSEQLNALVKAENTQNLQKAFKEGSDSVIQQVSAISNSFQSAVTYANGQAKIALEQAYTNLQQTVEELKHRMEPHANEFNQKLQVAVRNTMAESQKLAKFFISNVEQTNDKVTKQVKEAYDDFVKEAEYVQKKLHEAAQVTKQ